METDTELRWHRYHNKLAVTCLRTGVRVERC